MLTEFIQEQRFAVHYFNICSQKPRGQHPTPPLADNDQIQIIMTLMNINDYYTTPVQNIFNLSTTNILALRYMKYFLKIIFS